jgi:hypothetical protein
MSCFLSSPEIVCLILFVKIFFCFIKKDLPELESDIGRMVIHQFYTINHTKYLTKKLDIYHLYGTIRDT